MTKIDYKKELETASRGMIMIHDHVLLIRLLIRMLVRKVNLTHAGMIVYEPSSDTYILSVSRGGHGERIPENFVSFSKDHPLIRIFSQREYHSIIVGRGALLAEDLNRLIWQESVIECVSGMRELLHQVSDQMVTLNSIACVPAFYRRELLAVLLLGPKKDAARMEQEELDFFAALASDVAMAIRNARLFENLKYEVDRSRNMFIQTAIALGSAIEAKDSYTHGHTERVTRYSLVIARQMVAMGLFEAPPKFFDNLYIAGLLHDIGKIGIPESILMKNDRLTPEEFEIMKTHVTRGADILAPIKEFDGCIQGVRSHHERYDGSGYPDGIKGDAVPMIAAIIAVADTFDAMTTDRPYRKGRSRDFAVDEIVRLKGSWFHPKPVDALIAIYKQNIF